MTRLLAPTHHAGDRCPPDMFRVIPQEALRSALFACDVEVVGDAAPYTVFFGGRNGGPAIVLDTVEWMEKLIDSQGLTIVNVDAAPATGICVLPAWASPPDSFALAD